MRRSRRPHAGGEPVSFAARRWIPASAGMTHALRRCVNDSSVAPFPGGIRLRDVAARTPGQELVESEPHAIAVVARQVRHFLDHADRVLRTRFDAESAEDAARIIDLEAGWIFRVRGIVGVE